MGKLWPILGYVGLVLLGAGIVLVLALTGVLDKLLHRGSSTPSSEWGSFPTKPKVELLDKGHEVRLLEDFVYIDPHDKVWIAPKDSIVDGASIPRIFWTVTGGPLDGEYRDASIIHDVGCRRMTEPWEAVHTVFYEACRCGGVAEIKAKLLFAAVYHFGPRWEIVTEKQLQTHVGPDGKPVTRTRDVRVPKPRKFAESPDETVRKKLEEYIDRHNPSLEELKKLDPKSL